MHKVTFTEKNGTEGQATFPTLMLATMYARNVKGGKVCEGGTDDAHGLHVSLISNHRNTTTDNRRAVAESLIMSHIGRR